MSDFCYDRPTIRHLLRQARLMGRMMGRLGVDQAVAARRAKGLALFEARVRCIDCEAVPSCRAWLDDEGVDDSPPRFCPNARFFRGCLGRGRMQAIGEPIPVRRTGRVVRGRPWEGAQGRSRVAALEEPRDGKT